MCVRGEKFWKFFSTYKLLKNFLKLFKVLPCFLRQMNNHNHPHMNCLPFLGHKWEALPVWVVWVEHDVEVRREVTLKLFAAVWDFVRLQSTLFLNYEKMAPYHTTFGSGLLIMDGKQKLSTRAKVAAARAVVGLTRRAMAGV